MSCFVVKHCIPAASGIQPLNPSCPWQLILLTRVHVAIDREAGRPAGAPFTCGEGVRGAAAGAGHCPAVTRDNHLCSAQAGKGPHALCTKSNPGKSTPACPDCDKPGSALWPCVRTTLSIRAYSRCLLHSLLSPFPLHQVTSNGNDLIGSNMPFTCHEGLGNHASSKF